MSADPTIGMTFGNYRVEGPVGSGGMGRVYRGQHIRLQNRRVAIKVMDPIQARDPAFRARFEQEADAIQSLKHPHIVELFDFGEQAGQLYEIQFWKKALYPLACLVMMSLALPFAYMHVRSGGVSLKIFAGIMLGLVFHLLNSLFAHLGAINTWPPLLSAVTPALLFAALALLMLWRAGRA